MKHALILVLLAGAVLCAALGAVAPRFNTSRCIAGSLAFFFAADFVQAT